MAKDTIVEIPRGSGNKYRYNYSKGKMVYKGPVGNAPALEEVQFLEMFGNLREMDKREEMIAFFDEDVNRWLPEQYTMMNEVMSHPKSRRKILEGLYDYQKEMWDNMVAFDEILEDEFAEASERVGKVGIKGVEGDGRVVFLKRFLMDRGYPEKVAGELAKYQVNGTWKS